jgi:hypothetical protein
MKPNEMVYDRRLFRLFVFLSHRDRLAISGAGIILQ